MSYIGNQLKILLDYAVEESPIREEAVNAVMEVYAPNGTLLRTSSLPEPIVLDESQGNIQLATTFNDKNIRNVTGASHRRDKRISNLRSIGDKIKPRNLHWIQKNDDEEGERIRILCGFVLAFVLLPFYILCMW